MFGVGLDVDGGVGGAICVVDGLGDEVAKGFALDVIQGLVNLG